MAAQNYNKRNRLVTEWPSDLLPGPEDPSQTVWILKNDSLGQRCFTKPLSGLTILYLFSEGSIEEIWAGTQRKTSNTFSQGLWFNWSDRQGQLRLGHFLPPMRRSVFPQSNPRLSRPGHYRRAMTLPQLTPRSPCPCKLLTPMTTELRTTANWVHDVNISLGAEGPNKVILILVPDNKVVSTLGPERETHLKPDPLTVNSDIK